MLSLKKLFFMFSLLGVYGLTAHRAAARSAPQPPELPAAPAVCTSWFVSFGGVSQFVWFRDDPENTPLANLRTEWSYHTTSSSSKSYIDFNGDQLTDVFTATPLPGGSYQWRYSQSGIGPWQNLAHAPDDPSGLRFGEFDQPADAKTDIFSVYQRPDDNYQWRFSSGGTANYVDLAYSIFTLDQLRFGQFDTDSTTDVIVSQPAAAPGVFDYLVSSAARFNFEMLSLSPRSRGTPISDRLVGNFFDDPAYPGLNFTTGLMNFSPNCQEALGPVIPPCWVIITTGNPSQVSIRSAPGGTPAGISQLRIGNFGGDAYSDIFWTTLLPGGAYQWWYHTTAGNTVALNYSTTPLSDLRFGDFNGDGVTDIFTAIQTCPSKVFLPLMVK